MSAREGIDVDDSVLLGRFVETGCQASFEQIVARHRGWVFALALRAVRDRHLAEDVAQAVFIILARKAANIREGTPLSGWLFKACRFAVSDALKRRTRMKNRENRFAEFFKATNGGEGAADRNAAPGENTANIPDEISHTLDEAVAVLSEADRQAVLLRFYEGKSLAEVGEIMGTTEEAAKKRVSRAVEKLRKQFAKRGLIATMAVMLMMLGRRSAEAAQYAPNLVSPAAAPTIAHAIADGALQLMAHAQAKLLGAILAAGLAVLIAAPTLGSAVIRLTGFGGDAGPQVAQPLSSETIAYDAEPPRTPSVQPSRESKFTEVWIGYKGQLIWRSDAYTNDNPVPFYLKSAEKREKPYAVAVDKKGEYYIRPLDKALLESPVVRDGRFDYDNGPTDPAARVNQVLTLIDAHDDGFNLVHPSRGHMSGPISSIRHLVERKVEQEDKPPTNPAADPDWFKLQQHQRDDGSTIVDQAYPSAALNLMGNFTTADREVYFGHTSSFAFMVAVPEPGTGLLALAGASLLALRRRRRR